ncbi:squalene synthase [Crocinitomicaceae bacterium CZZ-1]|uniref:squalene synthase n=1 Tax=Taishania pollutisoli TaxID=2766479 RepID=A0A8J6P9I1_9FLAO|nr:squalene synthase [Taishania pollutisoli]MBC9811053.1 squalene synthase [Taishania pollutisoli]
MKKDFKQFKPSAQRLKDLAHSTDDLSYCYEALTKVSRSFAIVIQQLPDELKNPVCLFYLILRGLDTIEDDMNIDNAIKKDMLLTFADRINTEEFTLENVGDTQDYQDLMLHFDKVIREYQKLGPEYKTVITEITHEMATGMNKYAHATVESYEDWDDYCYYVAGLVGIGLTRLFLASKLETSPKLFSKELSNEMGLFLQKTNIIRDFAEDLEQGRIFWPEASWKEKAPTLHQLQADEKSGLAALNEVIFNALSHVPACLEFLECLENQKVFRFCAIPQLMAIATLKALYNNPEVLHKSVKIRKGKTAKYFMSIQDFDSTKKEFISILNSLAKKDNTGKIKSLLSQIQNERK